MTGVDPEYNSSFWRMSTRGDNFFIEIYPRDVFIRDEKGVYRTYIKKIDGSNISVMTKSVDKYVAVNRVEEDIIYKDDRQFCNLSIELEQEQEQGKWVLLTPCCACSCEDYDECTRLTKCYNYTDEYMETYVYKDTRFGIGSPKAVINVTVKRFGGEFTNHRIIYKIDSFSSPYIEVNFLDNGKELLELTDNIEKIYNVSSIAFLDKNQSVEYVIDFFESTPYINFTEICDEFIKIVFNEIQFREGFEIFYDPIISINTMYDYEWRVRVSTGSTASFNTDSYDYCGNRYDFFYGYYLYKVFYQFNLSAIPENAKINEAWLNVRASTSGDASISPFNLYLHLIENDSWDEGTDPDAFSQVNASASTLLDYRGYDPDPSSATWYKWNATAGVESEYSGDKILSLRLANLTLVGYPSTRYNFYSDASSYVPYLNISYRLPNKEKCFSINNTGPLIGRIKMELLSVSNLSNIMLFNISIYNSSFEDVQISIKDGSIIKSAGDYVNLNPNGALIVNVTQLVFNTGVASEISLKLHCIYGSLKFSHLFKFFIS